jgi:D-serine deaminase-like pyridoxal phosphate-dependent protein
MSLASAVSVVTEFRIIAGDQSLDTPLIAVDLDVLQRNIAEMAALAASYGVALRPHAKTH